MLPQRIRERHVRARRESRRDVAIADVELGEQIVRRVRGERWRDGCLSAARQSATGVQDSYSTSTNAAASSAM